MKKFPLLFSFFVLLFVSFSPFLRALTLTPKAFCDSAQATEGNTLYCSAVYSTVRQWYDADFIGHHFRATEGLSYQNGVWSYTNWPLQIIYTDAIWNGMATGLEYSNVIQYNDLVKMDSNQDLIPNRIQEINDYLTGAIEREVFELGFNHPAKQQDKFIVVRVEDGGWTDPTLPAGALGRAWVNDQGFPTMSLNPYVGNATLEKTVSHEFFHLIQFSYSPDFINHSFELNFSEATAMWMERLLFEFQKYSYEKDYLDFYQAYYSNPQRSLLGTNPTDKNFQYGTVLWPIYLEMQFKKSIIREIWEAYFIQVESTDNYNHSLYYAMDDVLKQRDSSLEETYRGFARWIFDKDQYRRDADSFPDVVSLVEIDQYPTQWMKPTDDLANPSLLGSTFIQFDTASASNDFYINFVGTKEAKWALDLYSVGSKNTYLSQFSSAIELGDGQVHELRIPKTYLGKRLVLIVSPVDAIQLTTTQNAFNFYFPFQFQAGFGKNTEQQKNVSVAPSVSEGSVSSGSLAVFSDVQPGDSDAEAIFYLQEKGIIGGYPDGTFRPHDTINRAELLKILIGDRVPEGEFKNCFPDVHTEWFAPYVCYAKTQGFVQGYPDGTFRPAQTVNRAEAIKMMAEVFKIKMIFSEELPYSDMLKNAWFIPYVQAAKSLGLLDEHWKKFQPAAGMKRGIMSGILYRYYLSVAS